MKIKELYSAFAGLDGKEISVNGWIRTLRSSKTFGFIEVNDGSFFKNIQVVFEEGNSYDFNEISKLNVGSAIRVKGTLVATPDAKQPLKSRQQKFLLRENPHLTTLSRKNATALNF